jgi:hypothetical protein
VKHDVTHSFTDRGAARLPDRHDVPAVVAEPLRETLGLDGLAGGLPTLEREEEAAHL